jgi:hypothetical protein
MPATRTVFIDTAISNYQSLATQYDASIFSVVLLNNASSHAEQIQGWMKSNGVSAADINIVSASTSVNGSFTPRVVFVDSAVADLNTVIAGVPANATVVVLDASRDGVQQIRDYLAANGGQVGAIDIVTDLASVDVVSHGAPGEVMLGSTVLNASNLAQYSSQLAEIGSHLTAGADLLLYGCDVASGTVGQQFISALANATGADVAASTDLTGSAAAGGDWTLEASTGAIETAALNIAGYDGVLDTATSITSPIVLSADTGTSSSDFITRTATQTFTGTFTANTNNSQAPTIYVSTDGTGASRTPATVTYTDNAGSGSFSATVNLAAGTGKSIQFWSAASGNNPISSSQAYTLDTTAPTTAVSSVKFSNDTGASSSDFITNTAAQTISGTLSANMAAGDVVRVSLDNGVTWQTASTTVNQNTFSLSGVTLQGSNTLKVQVEDAAGNAGPARSQAYVLDTVAPTASNVSFIGLSDSGVPGDGITNDRSFNLDLTSNDPSASFVFEVSVNGGAFTTTGVAQNNLADGSYLFRARVTDVAGNTTTTNTAGVTIDATAPNAPTITGFADNTGSASDTTTRDNTPTLTITAEADAKVEIFKGGVSVGTATQTAPHSGVYTFTSGVLTDGSYSFTAVATDAADNHSVASTGQNIVVDTTLTAPTVSLTTDSGTAGDGLTNNAGLSFNTADADATRVIKVDGTVVTAYDAKTLMDGTHTVEVTDTDAAGNTGSKSVSFTLDTTAPAPTAALTKDSGSNDKDGITNDASLTLGTLEDKATRVIKVDGTVVTAYDASALADGHHTVIVTDTDGAGNSGSVTTEFTLDTKLTAPTAKLAVDSGTDGDGVTNKADLVINKADDDATRVIKVDGNVVTSYDASALADGHHTVIVTDTDGAGNTASVTSEFTLDTKLTAPTAALALDSGTAGDGVTNKADLVISTADSDTTRVIKVDGNVVTSYDASKLADGHHTVIVTDTDGAGNTASVTSEFTLDTKLTAPTAALTLDSGTAGDGLTNNAGMTFNTADTDATRVIKVDGNVVTAYDASKLADGHHTVIVTDTDGAGNTASVTSEFTLDTKLTAPTAALTLDSGTAGDGLTNNAGLTLNTADTDATRVIKVDGNVVTVYDASKLADGHHTVIVTDTDGAGNTASVTSEFTLDTKLTAPTAALTLDSGTAGDGLTNNAGMTFNTADDDASRVIKVDGNVVTAYDASKLADGKHTVVVTDTDGAGNTASVTSEFILDTKLTAPTAALAVDSGTAGDALTNDASLNFNTADTDATRVIKVDGTVVDKYDAAKLADGKHTVVVTDTDAAGNTASVTSEFTLDTKLTAPTAALTLDSGTAGDGLTNNAGLTFNAADDDATRVIKVDGNVVTAYDASKLADGHHTVIVTDTDGAGNTASVTSEFTLDTKLTAPTASLAVDSGTAGDSLTNDASLNFNTADTDATRVIKVDGNVVTAYDASKLADGKHTVVVTDTDGAGNTASVTSEFTLDTKLTAPTAALTLDSGTAGDGLTNNAGMTFNTADTDATRIIKVDGNVVDKYDASKLADGKHTVVVTDTDAAGNTASVTANFELDTKLTAPTAALTLDSGTAGDGLTNNAGLTFNSADGDATRVIKVDGNVVTAYDASKLADGKHTVVVTDTDGAGNTASVTSEFTLDTKLTAPTAALTLDSGTAGDGLTNNAGLNFNKADDDATRVIKVDGNVVTAYDASKLADGHHTVIVTDTDAAGNTASVTSEFTLDTKLSAPTAALAVDSGTAGDSLTNNASLNFSTADADASRVIKVDGTVVDKYDASKLADGKHVVIVTDTDGAGNTASVTANFELDTKVTGPTAALTLDSGTAGDGLTNNAGMTFNTADTDATRVIKVDGNVVTAYDASKLTDGKHTVIVTDTDAAGNTASVTANFELDTKLTAPTAVLATDSGTAGDGLTNKADLNLSTADGDATRVIKVDGNVVTAYDASKLADGKHSVVVTDTDGAGNTASVTAQFTLDTKLTAPTAALTVDSGTAGDGLTNNAGLSFNTADGDATRVIKVDGAVVGSYDASKLADGKHTVIVTDTDAAGNTASATTNFELDSKGPTFSSAASASVAENIGENQLVYKAVAADPHGVSYTLAGADAAKFAIAADGSVTLKANPDFETVNAYGFTVVATDTAGNHTDQAVTLGITNVNEAPVATAISKSTIENAQITFQLADNVSDVDAGDKMAFSLGSTTASLSWANTDTTAPKTLINPVTKAVVDISTLSVKASLAADGSVTLTPPAELDWMSTGQALKATFSYTVTDAGGLKSQDSIDLIINGSTNDKGVNLSGGNGDDVMAGNATNNAEDVLMGNNGNDNLSGYGGTDALYGGNGDDKLSGGAGIDYLYGDNGNDTLDGGTEGDFIFGGKGNDLLTGGAGADKFVFAPQNGNDRITDFKLSEGDKLFFADFFSTPITVDAFLQKYVTDTGNDLQINLQGTTLTVVGVANVSDLAGSIVFGMPA